MYLCIQFIPSYIIQMGSFLYKSNDMLQAESIRFELCSRIQAKRIKFQNQFSIIEEVKRRKIIAATASELASMLDDFTTTSYEITLCFIQRASTVGLKNNYIIDELFQEALEAAKKCDEQRRKNPQKKSWKHHLPQEDYFPPFYGIPVSVKETFLMKGRQTYAGFVSKINSVPEEQSCFIQLIQAMGFIPFVRTNVPQACKSFQTNNNIFGYAKNPWDLSRSTGGSSGGEGGLVGSHSSPFGIGSDIGGSLRIPAEFNGLCTLKPAQRSIAKFGNAYYGRYAGGLTVKPEYGALARSVEDLINYNSFMFNPENYANVKNHKLDPHLNMVPLNLQIFVKEPKLKIGIVKRLDNLKASKTHERALKECEAILKEKGHEIVHIQLPDFEKLYFYCIQMNTCDQKLGMMEEIKKSEPLIKEYKLLSLFCKIPWFVRKIIIYFLRKKQPRLAKMLQSSRPLSVRQVFQLIYESQTVITRQIYSIFCRNKLDTVLMPGFVSAAPKLGTTGNLQYCLGFQTPWNVLNYPVGAIPVTTVEYGQTDFKDKFNDFYTKSIRQAMKESEGMPVGVQVGGLPKHEEKILYVMKQLEDKIQFRQKYLCPSLK